MATQAGRIPEFAFKVISGIFFGIAILAAIARTVIRLHLNQRLELDDGFLSLACVCFIATTILLYKMMPDIYLFETLETEPGSVAALIPPVEILQKVVWFENCDSAYLFVTWTAIFLVKASFLAFFRRLINRVGKMVTYWKVVVAITIVVFGFCACIGFIGCPKSGLDATGCARGALLNRALPLGAISISLDILTDVMIVAIPVWVLSSVKIARRQKIGMGVFLCLNIVMAIIAIVRVAGIRHSGAIDYTWIFFWQHIEVCVAVSMVSLTAFRSLFVSTSQGAPVKKARPWYSSQARKLRGAKGENLPNGGHEELPSIPGATMTGIRTFIRGHRGVSTIDSETGQEHSGALVPRNRDHIIVTDVVSFESQEKAKHCESSTAGFV